MRNLVVLSSAVALAACGGSTDPQSAGGTAPPPSSSTPTPTHSFVNPTEVKTYEGIGAVQNFQYTTSSISSGQGDQLYAGDANTVRNSGISVTYDPRDAIFSLTISRPLGNVDVGDSRFQDPVHRTAFGGAREPQAGVPDLGASKQIQYLQSSSGTGFRLTPSSPYYPRAAGSDYPVGDTGYSSTVQTLFYQKPGTTTKYVTYAGYVRNTVSAAEQSTPSGTAYLQQTYSLDRAAFVFGERTATSAVPKSGSGSFSGEMIATMVYNPTFDDPGPSPTYFQWIAGTNTTQVNFADLSVASKFDGKVFAPTLDAYTTPVVAMPAGSDFHAEATATIDMAGKGGFTGNFNSACFATACTSANSLTIAGSSIDGAFFGPNAQEVGGGFRIVGGRPDQRIDILGAFTAKQ